MLGDRLPDARLVAVGRDPPARAPARAPGGAARCPTGSEPVARYILQEGLPETLRVAAVALVGSTLIGIVLGTLLTIHFRPTRAADPALHRGLPRPADPRHGLPRLLRAAADLADARVLAAHRDRDRAHPLGQRAGRRGDARRGQLDPARAARGRRRARLRLGRPAPLRDPAAGAPPPAAAARQPAREHHPEHDAGRRDRRPRAPVGRASARTSGSTVVPPIGIGEIHAFEIFGAVAVLFFVISFPLTRLAAYLERRLIV